MNSEATKYEVIEMNKPMTNRERFLAVMEYKEADRVPNHEAGVWQQTIDRWEGEGLRRQI